MTEVERFPDCNYVFMRGLNRGKRCRGIGKYEGGKCCRHKPKLNSREGDSDGSPRREETQEAPLPKTASKPEVKRSEKPMNNTELLKKDPIFNEQVKDLPKVGERSSVW